jgi:hypothetical protein
MRKYSSALQSPVVTKGPRDLKPIMKPGRIIGVNSINDMMTSVLAWGQKPSHMEISTKLGNKQTYNLSGGPTKQELFKLNKT